MSHDLPNSQALARLGRLRRYSGWLLLALLPFWVLLVWNAPIDRVQGVIQKILYVHPPLAYGAYLGFVVTAIGGTLYLGSRRGLWDQLAVAGAEVGVIFCTLMMVTGPIWARGTWGQWWTWDPRLTLTLLLWFVYLSYLLLRSLTEGSERTARFAAVYGVAGTLLIPLNYFAIELAGGRAQHPENLERGSMDPEMWWAFGISNLVALAAFLHLLALRCEVEVRRVDAHGDEA